MRLFDLDGSQTKQHLPTLILVSDRLDAQFLL